MYTGWRQSVLCKVLYITVIVNFFLSSYTMLIIALSQLLVTRFVLIRQPLSVRQVTIYLLIGWLCAIVLSIGVIIYDENINVTCFPFLSHTQISIFSQVVILLLFCITFLITVAIICIYVSIYKYINLNSMVDGKIKKSRLVSIRNMACNVVTIEGIKWIAYLSVFVYSALYSDSNHRLMLLLLSTMIQACLYTIYFCGQRYLLYLQKN